MTSRSSHEMHERLIRNFMDLIILKELENSTNIGGYNIIILFRRKFHVLLPAGSLYSMLYAMEKKGLIESTIDGRKKVYRLAKKGKEKIQTTARDLDSILSFIRSILDGKSLPKPL